MFARTMVISALAATALAYGYEAPPKCTASGMRCIGQEGHEYVEYAPCCDPKEQCVDVSTKYGDWGSKCMEPVAPKCYSVGERCEGEKDHPYVPYASCCADASCEKVSGDWGKICVASKSYAPAPAPSYAPAPAPSYAPAPAPSYAPAPAPSYAPAPAPSYAPAPAPSYAPKCYKTGERCMGADYHPQVEYRDCCSQDDECVTSGYDWGKFCVKKVVKDYGPAAPEGDYGAEAPKCAKKDEMCEGEKGYDYVSPVPCCSGYECTGKPTGYGKYGKTCVEVTDSYKKY